MIIRREPTLITQDELPKFRVYGRYVCDHAITEAHLFDNIAEAIEFAREWGKDCNVGWLSPAYCDGKNRPKTTNEARLEIASRLLSTAVVDHRKIS